MRKGRVEVLRNDEAITVRAEPAYRPGSRWNQTGHWFAVAQDLDLLSGIHQSQEPGQLSFCLVDTHPNR